ncbi:hypothetical protein R6Q57_012445 [Mikania cordata]
MFVYCDGIKLGIQADCANRYKDQKTKLKKHFDKEGGYANTSRAKQNPPKGMDPEEWVQVIDWSRRVVCLNIWKARDMHFKGSSRWYNQLVEQHWENITDELNKEKSTYGGDDTPVDEVEVLKRSLANARWAEQQRINEMMQQEINKLMSMQGGQGSSSFYHPRFETNQEKDQDQEEDEDEDESE